MSRLNSFDARAEGLKLLSGLLGVETKTLVGSVDLVDGSPILNVFDPAGGDFDVNLPSFKRGYWFLVGHNGTDGTLVVKDSAGAVIGTVRAGELTLFACTGNSWSRTPGTFGPAGVGHSTGFVPDPGAVGGLVRFLADDGTWKSVTTAGIVDAYKTVTDGTNDSVASGLSTLKFRSADNSIAIVVTNNDATHGDNVDVQVVEANVNHNALSNYVADQHVAHSGVSITGAGGLTGGGAIDASRVLTLDITSLTTAAPLSLSDTMIVFSAGAGANRKALLSALNAILVHNDLSGYEANRHIDHSAVSISAGTGLSGGGNITASRSLAIDLNGLTTDSPGLSDLFMFYDVSGSDLNKATLSTLNGILDHNALLNYVSDQHVAHSGVSITAGVGLSGGGTIAATRSLSVDINGLTEDTSPVSSTDFVMTYDASAATLKKVKLSNLIGGAGTGDFVGPASSVANDFVTFNDTTGKVGKDSGLSLDIDGSLAADSDTKIPSQKAVVTYVANKLSSPPAFRADKGGTNQTDIADSSFTTLTWTEVFDNGALFASNAWVPKAGIAQMYAQCKFLTTNLTTGVRLALAIYKNGSLVAVNYRTYQGDIITCEISYLDQCNGTDSYSVKAFANTNAGTLGTVTGDATETYFQGFQVVTS